MPYYIPVRGRKLSEEDDIGSSDREKIKETIKEKIKNILTDVNKIYKIKINKLEDITMDFMIRELFKTLRSEGVTVKLLKADNGNYGIKFVDLNNKLSDLAYTYFYKYKNNEL